MVMQIAGNLRKLKTELATPVKYSLPIGEQLVDMNPLLGKSIELVFEGEINCVHCGRKTPKSYNQGYCFPCLRSLAECDSCLIKPEKCHYHEGTCREPAWGEEHCFQYHYVYLANTSGLKVGVTRQTNLPSRWLDQGAVQAIPVFRLANRLLAGKVEVAYMKFVADKTNWQAMLKGSATPVDLVKERDRLLKESEESLQVLKLGSEDITYLKDETVTEISYPVEKYPVKVKSLNFDKQPEISGVLQGIKGQYLIFDTGVLNVRKFSGYQIQLKL